jgi:uncharacterized protein (TIGR00369 family)
VNERVYGVASLETAASLTGLEFLTAMKKGDIPAPPFAQRIPLALHDFERGKVVMRIEVDDTYLNPAGLVHGGLSLIALDTAMGLAVMSNLGRGKGFASIDTSARFIRALRGGESHNLEITGTVVSTGMAIATARGEIRTLSGKLVATGTSACSLFSLLPHR